MTRLKVAPTYIAKKMRKGSFSVRLTSGKFEGVTYKVHSVELKGNNLSFHYDLIRVPKAVKELMITKPTLHLRQFHSVVKNIMHNALVSGTRESKRKETNK